MITDLLKNMVCPLAWLSPLVHSCVVFSFYVEVREDGPGA
jgi:hypothetical protein